MLKGVHGEGGMHGNGGHAWQGGMHGKGVCIPCTPPSPRDMAGQCVGSMHPTGMHSC